jgi:hypothetical protein
MKLSAAFLLAFAGLALAACDPNDDTKNPDAAPEGSFSVDGIASGDALPATGKTMVGWAVFTGNGNDHGYIYGKGTQTGSGFHVGFPAAPPAEALNHGIGVGVVVLFGADATLPPEGVVTGEPPGVIGGAVQDGIIYKAADASPDILPWASAFPAGFSCGHCVKDTTGTTFDTFAPLACGQVNLIAPSNLDSLGGCNFF